MAVIDASFHTESKIVLLQLQINTILFAASAGICFIERRTVFLQGVVGLAKICAPFLHQVASFD